MKNKFIEIKKQIINSWKIIFGCALIPLSLKSIFIGSITVWATTPPSNKFEIEIPIKTMLIPSSYTICSLCLLVATIGLLMKKNWARVFIFFMFPIYSIFSLMFYQYVFEGNMIKSLYWNSLIPIFYIVLLYFFTRNNIKDQFK